MIRTLPAATPVTSPEVELTVAMDAFDELHSTDLPVSVLPEASRSVAVACTVCPTCTVAALSETVTVATG
jgi:hypothetical protein